MSDCKVTEEVPAAEEVAAVESINLEEVQLKEKQIEEDIEERLLRDTMITEELLQETGDRMLDYEKQIFLDMLQTDSLVVCAKGISYEKILINLIKVHFQPQKLIFVINFSDYEEKLFSQKLGEDLIREVSSNANERETNYPEGGVYFITTRIFVVDLLKKRIPFTSITGIIILRAHSIIESCQEAFALRLYRQNNKTGFVKAFSSSAESFTFGYGHVEKVMRNLFITDLMIWPRFHVTIQKSLKPFEPQVIELQIPMTQQMTLIQTHILDLMNYTVKEVKRINRFVDMQEVTVENCVTKKFHKILQSQLDTIWHQLSSLTKLLISDLKVLRSLMISTIYHDSVTLFSVLRKYRSTEYAMNNSGWILLDSAEQMFKLAKNRIFNKDEEFEPEFSPKWKSLSEIIRVEIPADLKRQKITTTNPDEEPVKVLILCQDARTCYQLNQYLTQGGEKYLFYTAIKNDIQIAKISDKYKEFELPNRSINIQSVEAYCFKRPGAASSKINTKPGPSTSGSKNFLRDRLTKKLEESNQTETTINGDDTLKGKDDQEEEEELNFYRDSYVLTMSQKPRGDVDPHSSVCEERPALNSTLLEDGEFESFQELEDLDITNMISSTVQPIVCIQTFKSEQNGIVSLEKTLETINPKYIIMYHCNVTAIRQIEIFEARKNRPIADRVKIFFLIHSQTVEEQSYLTSLRREKQAFELLIDTKSVMVVPEYQSGKTDEPLQVLLKSQDPVEVSTRNAGGQEIVQVKETPRVIVDMREFRSDLPCLIHKRGIEVVPVTITIGDYILTPEICVERKSISDLIGSLNSGRLYTQCVQMTRYYTKPILLIEFDQNKPFHLQGHYMISSESSSSNVDITQKLQLLTIHFPKLKLVWSPSPYATAKLFEEIKLGKPEPDSSQAALLGSDGIDAEFTVDRLNPTIHDFLIKLPGIDSRNVCKLMRCVKNMKELMLKTQDELEVLLNGKGNAKMLWEILHINHKPFETDEKQGGGGFKRGGGKGFRGRR